MPRLSYKLSKNPKGLRVWLRNSQDTVENVSSRFASARASDVLGLGVYNGID